MLEAVDRLVEHFSIPLKKAKVCHSEFESALQYACQYICQQWSIVLFGSASEWLNALPLVELLFSLPASNGVVEKVFSQVIVIIGVHFQMNHLIIC